MSSLTNIFLIFTAVILSTTTPAKCILSTILEQGIGSYEPTSVFGYTSGYGDGYNGNGYIGGPTGYVDGNSYGNIYRIGETYQSVCLGVTSSELASVANLLVSLAGLQGQVNKVKAPSGSLNREGYRTVSQEYGTSSGRRTGSPNNQGSIFGQSSLDLGIGEQGIIPDISSAFGMGYQGLSDAGFGLGLEGNLGLNLGSSNSINGAANDQIGMTRSTGTNPQQSEESLATPKFSLLPFNFGFNLNKGSSGWGLSGNLRADKKNSAISNASPVSDNAANSNDANSNIANDNKPTSRSGHGLQALPSYGLQNLGNYGLNTRASLTSSQMPGYGLSSDSTYGLQNSASLKLPNYSVFGRAQLPIPGSAQMLGDSSAYEGPAFGLPGVLNAASGGAFNFMTRTGIPSIKNRSYPMSNTIENLTNAAPVTVRHASENPTNDEK